jgi:hypothetical protein
MTRAGASTFPAPFTAAPVVSESERDQRSQLEAGMGTPVLFVVEEDRTALGVLAAGLGRRFGADYQILAGPSPGRH